MPASTDLLYRGEGMPRRARDSPLLGGQSHSMLILTTLMVRIQRIELGYIFLETAYQNLKLKLDTML